MSNQDQDVDWKNGKWYRHGTELVPGKATGGEARQHPLPYIEDSDGTLKIFEPFTIVVPGFSSSSYTRVLVHSYNQDVSGSTSISVIDFVSGQESRHFVSREDLASRPYKVGDRVIAEYLLYSPGLGTWVQGARSREYEIVAA